MAVGVGENDSRASASGGGGLRKRQTARHVWLAHKRANQAVEFVIEPCRRPDNKQLMMLADLLVFVSPWNTCYV